MFDLNNIKISQATNRLTKSVLGSIAKHLSYRASCRGRIYRVAIGVYDPNQLICRLAWQKEDCENCIFFDTDVRVYPSKHDRKYEIPVIQHIIIGHFGDILYAGCANGNQVQIKGWLLTPGIYEYQNSTSGKYRRWVKVK